ncbi:MAG: pirin [Alphaproteobacteria bacterium]|nr:pirin [Alphaproteobacteria bacterium]MBF0391494.1 pirin [Alphaproteobacteria bacterium]
MGQIHQLIKQQGIDQARASSSDKLDRTCIDTAYAVMSDEEQRIGIMHAGFAMTALPHKDLGPETVWIRHGGNIKLRIESGTDIEDNSVGIPFGSVARMILLYLQTEAVRTRSRDIELGRSMNQWLCTMGIDNGGKTYRIVREQCKRLSLCRLTFYRSFSEATLITNGSFVRDAIVPTKGDRDSQMTLWREAVRLDESFYQSLIEHPLPVLETAIKQIGQRSAAIDVYIWLAYRLHRLEKPTPITWRAMFDQFGAGYQEVRFFRRKFHEPLALALAAYPDAHVSMDETGVILYPSPPPVRKRPALI